MPYTNVFRKNRSYYESVPPLRMVRFLREWAIIEPLDVSPEETIRSRTYGLTAIPEMRINLVAVFKQPRIKQEPAFRIAKIETLWTLIFSLFLLFLSSYKP